MKAAFITGIAITGLTIFAASYEASANERDTVIQKWVDAAEACLKEEGVYAEEGSKSPGCYVIQGPRVYCDPGLPNGRKSAEVGDKCYGEATASMRPKRFGSK